MKLTASVTGAAPTGQVLFKDGATVLGTVALAGTGDTRTAEFVTTALVAGSHSITATYAGDASNLPSTSIALAQVITAVVIDPPPPLGPGLSVALDFGGGSVARFSGGEDIGTFDGEFVHQRCFLALDPAFPDWRVMFRPDVDGSREEVVVEYGRAVGGTPANRMEPYTATITRDGAVVYTATVPTHWWDARWRWQSAPRPVVRTPEVLMSRGWIPKFGAAGLFGRAPMTYSGVHDGPMTIPAHMSTGMGAAGENNMIGHITESAAEYVIRRQPNHLITVMVEGEATATWAMHTRFADGSMPDVAGDNLHYIGAGVAGSTINQPRGVAHPDYEVIEYAHWFPAMNMAWLLTDDPFMLEELQFGVNSRLFYSTWARVNLHVPGMIDPGQVRSAAWGLRDQFLCAASTPVTVPKWLQPRSTWKAQIDQMRVYMTRYTVSNIRALALFRCWFRADMVASWMTSFLNVQLGLAVSMGFSEWKPIFAWGMGQHIAMADGKSGWNADMQPTPYYWKPLKDPAYRSPTWPPVDDAAMDAVTYESWQAASDALSIEKGGAYLISQSYALQVRAALSMAVTHGIPDAQQCLDRLTAQIVAKGWDGMARFAIIS